jgi:hypothetical protein
VRREDFEHVIRVSAGIVNDEIVVIGSQALHGQFQEVPEALLVSREVDVYPKTEPERADEIDARIGDGSAFDTTYGYYARGVGPETPVAPAGWEGRLIRIELPRQGLLPAATAWCMEMHDLVLSKLAAGRSHDLEFALEAVRFDLVDREQLRLGVGFMPAAHRKIAGTARRAPGSHGSSQLSSRRLARLAPGSRPA